MRLIALAGAFFVAAMSNAQAWPDQPIRMVVGYAAGGTTDVAARLVGERLAARIGKPVVIENVAGAGGNTGAALVAKAPADGYTILMATPGQAVMNQFMYSRMPFDTATAFAPVAYIASVPSVLVVSPTLGVTTTSDFLTKMKARPDGANFGSAGLGSTGHLGGTLLAMKTGLKAQHVPYRGSAPMLQDLMAGNIQFTIDTAPGVMSFVTSGTLKALAVTGKARAPALPDVPNNVEAGIPDVEMASWLVVLAPAGTPKDIVARLNREIDQAVAEPVLKEKIEKLGAVPTGGSPDVVVEFLRGETEKWKAVIQAATIKIE
ncbi:Bug family tripartite tricarboxylate transporter substrate binding protein [Rhodoplanes sp. Z2-YC6860]|uniref:Bug family tripartite tricarboxylate transporter substrate binding protein n=1 Tax=Rhodoplanes sp. Z2-YC6860 TaxID=674703 RepID=UPI00078E053A|nr:tripartite tricarboxylate transporter substrate-binding protein [Rhodoplanes sp. Z2-YC6860]AMN40625.1 extracytoplasmic binding receptor [Rhodoplanes sp. Z2-YC6860]